MPGNTLKLSGKVGILFCLSCVNPDLDRLSEITVYKCIVFFDEFISPKSI